MNISCLNLAAFSRLNLDQMMNFALLVGSGDASISPAFATGRGVGGKALKLDTRVSPASNLVGVGLSRLPDPGVFQAVVGAAFSDTADVGDTQYCVPLFSFITGPNFGSQASVAAVVALARQDGRFLALVTGAGNVVAVSDVTLAASGGNFQFLECSVDLVNRVAKVWSGEQLILTGSLDLQGSTDSLIAFGIGPAYVVNAGCNCQVTVADPYWVESSLDPLGDCTALIRIPSAASSSAFVPSVGSDNSACVSDQLAHLADTDTFSDTTFVSTSTDAAQDLYSAGHLLSADDQVIAVVNFTAFVDTDASHQISQLVSSAGHVAASPSIAAPNSGTVAILDSAVLVDPATGDPWTPTAVDASLMGVRFHQVPATIDSVTWTTTTDSRGSYVGTAFPYDNLQVNLPHAVQANDVVGAALDQSSSGYGPPTIYPLDFTVHVSGSNALTVDADPNGNFTYGLGDQGGGSWQLSVYCNRNPGGAFVTSPITLRSGSASFTFYVSDAPSEHLTFVDTMLGLSDGATVFELTDDFQTVHFLNESNLVIGGAYLAKTLPQLDVLPGLSSVYWEVEVVAVDPGGSPMGPALGWNANGSYCLWQPQGVLNDFSLGSGPNVAVPTFAAGDVLMFAFDAATGNGWVGKNGVWANGGNPATGASPAFNLGPFANYQMFYGERQPTPGSKAHWVVHAANLHYAKPAGFVSLRGE